VESIQDNLHDCDYLFWINVDAVFYSHIIALNEDILPLLQGTEILCPVDICGEAFRWNSYQPSAGIILLRNSELTRCILNDWNSMTDITRLEHTKYDRPVEQLGLRDYIVPKYKDHIEITKNIICFILQMVILYTIFTVGVVLIEIRNFVKSTNRRL